MRIRRLILIISHPISFKIKYSHFTFSQNKNLHLKKQKFPKKNFVKINLLMYMYLCTFKKNYHKIIEYVNIF